MKAFLSPLVRTIVVTSLMFITVANADVVADQVCGIKYTTETESTSFIDAMATEAQRIISTSSRQASTLNMSVPDVKLQDLAKVPARPLSIGGFEALDKDSVIYTIEYVQKGESQDRIQILAQCDRKASVTRVLRVHLVRDESTYAYNVRYQNGQLSFSGFSGGR